MAIADDIGIDYVDKRVYWKGSGESGAVYGYYTMQELYTYLMDTFDELTTLDDSVPIDYLSPTAYKALNQWYFSQELLREHIRGAGFQTTDQDQLVIEVICVSGGYVNCVAGDIGKDVTDDGIEVGVLLDYNNTTRTWWIRATNATSIATASVLAVSGGTGAGTTTGSSSLRGDIQIISLGSGGYVSCIAGDIGKAVTDDGVEIGNLLDYNNTTRKWWVRSSRVCASSSTMAIASGTGAGTSDAASDFGEDKWQNVYTLGQVAHGNFYIEQNGVRLTSYWDGANCGIRKLVLASGGYVNCIEGDLGKTVTGGTTGDTGILLAYNNTTRAWFVRMIDSGDVFDDASEAITISGGTGAGSMDGVATTAEGNSPTQSGFVYIHSDILIKVYEAGAAIDGGDVIIYNRNYGDTYSHIALSALAGGDRTPAPLATQDDPNTTLTSAQIAEYVATGHGGTGNTADIAVAFGTYAADVDSNDVNEDYSVQVDCDGTEATAISLTYQALMWICSKDQSGETLDGKDASLYRSGDAAFTDEPAAPFGYYAGGKLICAQGVYPINLPTADASNYLSKDDAGVQYTPPTMVPVSVTQLISTSDYDKVAIYQSLGVNSLSPMKNELTSHATNNVSTSTTFECQENIPKDKPASGAFKVVKPDGTEYRYEYSSYTGKIFTLTSGTLGADFDASDTVYVGYIDAQASGSSISASLQYVATRNVVVIVRNNAHATSPMKPFRIASQITANGASIPCLRVVDTQTS